MIIFRRRAAASDRSIIRRFLPNGPRSLIRTTTCLPLLVLTTRTRVGDAGGGGGGQVDADSPGGKLTALLNPLCSTPADNEVLEKLAAKVLTYEEDGSGAGKITFQDDFECEFQRGSKEVVQYHDGMPKSFCEIAEVVTHMTWDAGGPDGGYGQDGDDPWLLDELEDDDKEGVIEAIEAAGDVTGAFFGGQGNNIFDPTNKLDNGEAGIVFISHEGGGGDQVEGVKQYDYKQIFLRLAANALGEFDYIDDIRLTD